MTKFPSCILLRKHIFLHQMEKMMMSFGAQMILARRDCSDRQVGTNWGGGFFSSQLSLICEAD